jgi:hypothetical protein
MKGNLPFCAVQQKYHNPQAGVNTPLPPSLGEGNIRQRFLGKNMKREKMLKK